MTINTFANTRTVALILTISHTLTHTVTLTHSLTHSLIPQVQLPSACTRDGHKRACEADLNSNSSFLSRHFYASPGHVVFCVPADGRPVSAWMSNEWMFAHSCRCKCVCM